MIGVRINRLSILIVFETPEIHVYFSSSADLDLVRDGVSSTQLPPPIMPIFIYNIVPPPSPPLSGFGFSEFWYPSKLTGSTLLT